MMYHIFKEICFQDSTLFLQLLSRSLNNYKIIIKREITKAEAVSGNSMNIRAMGTERFLLFFWF